MLKDKEEEIVNVFLFTPFISSYFLVPLISGQSHWGPFHVYTTGVLVRLLYGLVFSISLFPAFFVIIKLPLSKGGLKNVIRYIKTFVFIRFMILWMLLIVFSFLSEIYSGFTALYFIIAGFCFYYQIDYIDYFKKHSNL